MSPKIFLIVAFGLVAGVGLAQPTLAKSKAALAATYADQGDWDRAIPLAQELTKNNPAEAFNWMVLGWGYRFTHRYQEALGPFQKALELGATNPSRIEFEIASCEAGAGNLTESMRHLKRSFDGGFPSLSKVRNEPLLKPLQSSKEFRDMYAMPDLAKMTRNQRWAYDTDLLVREIERVHYNPYRLITREEWDRRKNALKRRISSLNDLQMTAELMKLMRMAGDGHSSISAAFQRMDTQEALPLLVGCFDDGFFITATTKEFEPLLWTEVVAIEGKPVKEVYEGLDCITPQDNPLRAKSVSPQYIRYPQILYGLGLAKSPDQVSFTIIDRAGNQKDVNLRLQKGAITDFVREPSDGSGHMLPAILKRPDLYWLEYLESNKTLLFHYNGVGDKPDESIEQFAAKLREFLGAHEVDKLVVDLRFNGGGNNFLNVPLLNVIAGDPKINRPGHLYVITGRSTFSAAICFAEQLERYTEATMVGEPTSSGPNFIGENSDLVLPGSGLKCSISNLFWQNGPAMDHRIWIAPQIPVSYRFADLRVGRDAAVEAILADK